MTETNTFEPKLKTGEYVSVDGEDTPNWAVIDGATGKVITFANTRRWAREFADSKNGERIARVHSVSYEVSK